MEISLIFNEMIKTAEDIFCGKAKYQNAQAVVVLTENGNKYGAFIADPLTKEKTEEREFIGMLSLKEEKKLKFILCLWQDGGIDVPSCDLRKMFLGLAPENTDAGIFVMSESGPSIIKLGVTI